MIENWVERKVLTVEKTWAKVSLEDKVTMASEANKRLGTTTNARARTPNTIK